MRPVLEGLRSGLAALSAPASSVFGSPRNRPSMKEFSVKKIALTLIAVSALGLAACNKSNPTEDAANNLAATANQAIEDTQNATDDMRNQANETMGAAQDQANQAVESTGNVADAAAAAVANETAR
jgi:hypothetical protein